jgi:adenylate cyclase
MLRVADPPVLSTIRGAGFDTLQSLWPRHDPGPLPVRIVDIDEASLANLGQWPWPRTKLAKLVDELSSLGASAIVFDVVFPEPDRYSPSQLANNKEFTSALSGTEVDASKLIDNDVVFANALTGRPVVNAFATSLGVSDSVPQTKAAFAQTGNSALGAAPTLSKLTHNLPVLDNAATGLGSMDINLAIDQGIARQIPLIWSDGKNFYPSLVLEALRVAQGVDTYVVNASPTATSAIESLRVGDIEIPTSEAGTFQVYYNHDDPNLYVSAVDVINNTAREKIEPLIKDHIVLIGTSAVGLLDIRTSSLGEEIPGVSVHAQALQQILSGQFLSRPESAVGLELIFVAVFGLAIALASTLLSPLRNIILMISIIGGLCAVVAYAFRKQGILLDFTFPILTLVLTYLATNAYRLLITDQESRQMRGIFSHYVAPTVLAEIERNPTALKLGGEIRDVTVLFVDIQNFTPLGEKLDPQELVRVVNGVLSACSSAILAQGGTIDKYIGDAVMAFWNAPLPQQDHQFHAASAALKIQQAIDNFNELEEFKPVLKAAKVWPIAVRIGLASGPAVVGNMGSNDRYNYSVLGEAVNIAARAEASCKHVGHNIIIAGALEGRAIQLATLPAGTIAMKGKSHKIPVSALIGDEATCASHHFQDLDKAYAALLRTLSKRWTKASDEASRELAAQYPNVAHLIATLERRRGDFLQ